MTIKQNIQRVLILVLVFTLSSCDLLGGESDGTGDIYEQDLNAWISNEKSKPAPPIDPLPVVQQFETFKYTAHDLRDPFSDKWSNKEEDLASTVRPQVDRRKEALEQFPLDSLRMVGTIGDKSSKLAGLVMSPDRVVHRVLPGAYLGQNDGEILVVSPDHIELLEIIPNGSGGWEKQSVKLLLTSKDN